MKDVYQLCPPLFSLNALRCDSPNKQNVQAYRRDAAFFKANPRRRLYLRDAVADEFDLELSVGEWLEVPTLHVLVMLISPGLHLVVPVYRGRRFYSDATNTDDEVGLVLAEFAKREGIDVGEWMMFELGQKQKRNALDKVMVH